MWKDRKLERSAGQKLSSRNSFPKPVGLLDAPLDLLAINAQTEEARTSTSPLIGHCRRNDSDPSKVY